VSNILIVYHSQTGKTKEMAQAVVGGENSIDNVTLLVTTQVVRFTVQGLGLAPLCWPLYTLDPWRHRVRSTLPRATVCGSGLPCKIGLSQESDELRIRLGIETFGNMPLFNLKP